MRRFFHLLTLIALLIAPLAAPATATAGSMTAHCPEMNVAEADHGMPAADHEMGEACCIAVPPAINAPLNALDGAASIGHLAFVAEIEPFPLGAGPNAEDPPPRNA